MSFADRHERMLDRCVQSLSGWKQLILEHMEDEQEIHTELDKLKAVVKDYCIINNSYKKSEEAIKTLEEKISGENNGDNVEIYKLYEECLSNLPESSNEGNYKSNPIWEKVVAGIVDVVEVKKKKRKLNDSQYEELNDSILCSNVFTPPVDPMTKMVVRNPYRHKRCNHIYEYESIVNYIKQQKNKAKCPYIGCTITNLRITDLIADRQLESQITQHVLTQTQSSDTEDD